MDFTCTAATVDNLYTPPTIEWRYERTAVPDRGDPRMNSTTGQLIFSDIINENSGNYTCQAIISIPESGIDNHYGETSTTINTDNKPIITVVMNFLLNQRACIYLCGMSPSITDTLGTPKISWLVRWPHSRVAFCIFLYVAGIMIKIGALVDKL